MISLVLFHISVGFSTFQRGVISPLNTIDGSIYTVVHITHDALHSEGEVEVEENIWSINRTVKVYK